MNEEVPIHRQQQQQSGIESDSVMEDGANIQVEERYTGKNENNDNDDVVRQQSGDTKLVDHVPLRSPEPRYADASVLVAADPSEVMSEVDYDDDDDLLHDEENFGPVVDHLPFTTTTPQRHSAAATAGGDHTEDGADDDTTPVQFTKMRAGDDDGVQSSSMLLQPVTSMDTDDNHHHHMEAGDVFVETDNTSIGITNDPSLRHRGGGAGATSSSYRQFDSTATARRSQTTFGDDDANDDDVDDESYRYGPVVDQLPTSRASVAPSRGGSTVDALANASEDSDDDDDYVGGELDTEGGFGIDDTTDYYDASYVVSEATDRLTLDSTRKL